MSNMPSGVAPFDAAGFVGSAGASSFSAGGGGGADPSRRTLAFSPGASISTTAKPDASISSSTSSRSAPVSSTASPSGAGAASGSRGGSIALAALHAQAEPLDLDLQRRRAHRVDELQDPADLRVGEAHRPGVERADAVHHARVRVGDPLALLAVPHRLRPALEQEQLAVAVDRPLEVLVGAVVLERPVGELGQRRDLVLLEAQPRPPLVLDVAPCASRRPRDRGRTPAPCRRPRT